MPSVLTQISSTQNPRSQSQSVEQGFGMQPPMVAVGVQTKFAGQPVWLHGNAWHPCSSTQLAPTAQTKPVGHVYPALQSTGTQSYLSAPGVPGEQVVPAAQVKPPVLHESSQTVEVNKQHLIRTVMQWSAAGQSLSTVHACVGGVTQNGVAHAERTEAGSSVQ